MRERGLIHRVLLNTAYAAFMAGARFMRDNSGYGEPDEWASETDTRAAADEYANSVVDCYPYPYDPPNGGCGARVERTITDA